MERQIGLRFLTDIFASVYADQVDRRADEFARVGNERCDDVARALRRKAWLLRHPEYGSADV